MTPERSLLIHRLLLAAEAHQAAADEDHYADDAIALALASEREPLLCAELLREAVGALRKAGDG